MINEEFIKLFKEYNFLVGVSLDGPKDINDTSFSNMLNSNILKDFIDESKNISARCKNCKYFALCRGGCRRYRTNIDRIGMPFNKYCGAYYNFFERNLKGLVDIANTLI